MPRFFVAVLISFTITFISCQKDVSEQLPVSPPQPIPTETVEDSILLSKLVFVSGATLSDTSYWYDITYDAMKRIKTVIATYLNDPGDTYEETRFYNGNDTLPYKIAMFWDGEVYDTSFLTYNNGSIIKDSLISHEVTGGNESIYSMVFSFVGLSSNRYLIEMKTHYGIGSGSPIFITDTTYSNFTIQNGNELTRKDSSYTQERLRLDIFSYQTNYDDKPNALKQLSLPYPVVTEDLLSSHVLFGSQSRNNPVSATVSHVYYANEPGPYTETYTHTYSYQYRSDGYPILMNLNDGTNDIQQLLLYYTK